MSAKVESGKLDSEDVAERDDPLVVPRPPKATPSRTIVSPGTRA
jgi:hypothetical protein